MSPLNLNVFPCTLGGRYNDGEAYIMAPALVYNATTRAMSKYNILPDFNGFGVYAPFGRMHEEELTFKELSQ